LGSETDIELAPFYYEYGNALLTKVFVHSCDVIPIDWNDQWCVFTNSQKSKN